MDTPVLHDPQSDSNEYPGRLGRRITFQENCSQLMQVRLKYIWKVVRKTYWVELSLIQRAGSVIYFFQFVDFTAELPCSA